MGKVELRTSIEKLEKALKERKNPQEIVVISREVFAECNFLLMRCGQSSEIGKVILRIRDKAESEIIPTVRQEFTPRKEDAKSAKPYTNTLRLVMQMKRDREELDGEVREFMKEEAAYFLFQQL